MSRPKIYTERVRFSLPSDKVAELTARAKILGISRSELLRRITSEDELEHMTGQPAASTGSKGMP